MSDKKFLVSEFSRKTGLEITATTKLEKTSQKPMCGQVTIRFFPLSQGTEGQIRYMMEPGEAIDIAYKIRKILAASVLPIKDKIKTTMPPHKFVKDGVDILTSLTIECYSSGTGDAAKNNYAVSVSRGKDKSVNVPIMESRLYRMALFLEHLSMQQSWEMSEFDGSSNSVRNDEQHEPEPQETPPERTKLEILSEKVKKHGIDTAAFLKHFGAESLTKFPDNRIDEALGIIASKYEKSAA